jgi:uncharacterized FlaG/YvyC family protein
MTEVSSTVNDAVSNPAAKSTATESREVARVIPAKIEKPADKPKANVNETLEQVADDSAVLAALSSVKLAITIDESADLPVIKIFDSESGKEIVQVPAEHSLNISRSIKAAVGALFDKSA